MILNTKIKTELIKVSEVSNMLWNMGWAEKSGGNISVDITDKIDFANTQKNDNERSFKIKAQNKNLSDRYFIITPAGTRLRDIGKDPLNNLLIIKIFKNAHSYSIVWPKNCNNKIPTSELDSHLLIHSFLKKNKRKERAILHTHPLYLTALSLIKKYEEQSSLNDLLFSMHPEIKIFLPQGIGLVPYTIPGSLELAKKSIKALNNKKIAIWQKHGCLGLGKDVHEAFDFIHILEKAAHIFFTVKKSGLEPQRLKISQIKEINNTFH